jgi:hypothetical protein
MGRTRSRFDLTRQGAVDVRQISLGEGDHMARFCNFPRSCPEQQDARHSLPVAGEECRSRVKKATVEALTLTPPAMPVYRLCPGTVEGEHLADSLCIASQGGKRQLPVLGRQRKVPNVLHLGGRDLDGPVLGHGERSSKPQTAVEARYHLWHRLASRRVIRKITARGRTGLALAIAQDLGLGAAIWKSRAIKLETGGAESRQKNSCNGRRGVLLPFDLFPSAT